MPEKYKSIAEIIKTDKRFNKIREIAKDYSVINEFYTIFPDLTKIAKAVRVDKQTLFLRVENSVWRSELNFRQKIIVDKINFYFKEKVIKSVRFIA